MKRSSRINSSIGNLFEDLCKRFDEALQFEQKAIQKAANQQRRSSNSTIDLSSTASPKVEKRKNSNQFEI